MSGTVIPSGYRAKLGLYETQSAIGLIKDTFQASLSALLNLKRVSAPLFVNPQAGLNDNLNGVERPVAFDIPSASMTAEVVHSLAKWKRYALGRYGFEPGKGLYTDMNAIRRDETLDNLHSAYVDQWDWEKVLLPGSRNMETFACAVDSIVEAVTYTLAVVKAKFDQVDTVLERRVRFLSSEELISRYPGRGAKEREYCAVKEFSTVCITGIGGVLSDGKPHDGRAPDYDDWSMNGDILFYDPVLDCAMELSSMGVRVDAEALDRQLAIARCDERRSLPFHKALLAGELPDTIGGGIGQSRLCMLLLGKAHIGEVQSSLWDEETMRLCQQKRVTLL